MDFIRGLHNLKPRHRGCVATIGNFDGVHLGHQAVIGQLARKAAALELPTTLILFEPQPLEFFQPDSVPARLTRLREKLEQLRRHPVDRILCMEFTAAFAAWSAEQFIARVLVQGLDVRYLVVGDDFRFGAGRRGDFALLREAGKQHGFDVVATDTVAVQGERVSSTRVREYLASHDLAMAERLLGRPYGMSGRVAHGNKLGRELGIPTANIHVHRRRTPVAGIFVAEVVGLGSTPLPGVASVGTQPTVGGTRTLLEVHLLDFNRDIYGKHVTVNFLKRLRDEQRFESLEELKQWIERDIADSRLFFSKNRPQRARDSL
ncbi:MAG TPA: bifunctional riboflavin kinase/FAD synthetase [Burkholderiales bacterium]|nr:bifunctional riboflavin kinase/FAD synthetase [Burkholderiales bacterium]